MKDIMEALPEAQKAVVNRLMQTDQFNSPIEVISTALNHMEQTHREHLRQLQAELDKGEVGLVMEEFDFTSFRNRLAKKQPA